MNYEASLGPFRTADDDFTTVHGPCSRAIACAEPASDIVCTPASAALMIEKTVHRLREQPAVPPRRTSIAERSPQQGSRFDFYERIERQCRRSYGGSRGRILGEELSIDDVHLGEIAHIL